MTKVTYEIVEHDGGWAYRLGGTYSETFRSHADALAAAKIAAAEQQVAGKTEGIEYEDAEGKWHGEVAAGSDRPRPKSSTPTTPTAADHGRAGHRRGRHGRPQAVSQRSRQGRGRRQGIDRLILADVVAPEAPPSPARSTRCPPTSPSPASPTR